MTVLPAVRSEFDASVRWQPLSTRLKRYELTAPSRSGPVIGVSNALGAVHIDRSSLILRVDGGHLRDSRENLLAQLTETAQTRLIHGASSPLEHAENIISWLEEEQKSGILERSYTTVMLLLVISDTEAWTWHSGPHGVAVVNRNRVHFRSTDIRYPLLRRLGVIKPSSLDVPGKVEREKASSIFCIGTPVGYEKLRLHIGPGEVAIACECATLPFGPLTTEAWNLCDLWHRDALWQHGVRGISIAVGQLKTRDLALPDDWRAREIPFL